MLLACRFRGYNTCTVRTYDTCQMRCWSTKLSACCQRLFTCIASLPQVTLEYDLECMLSAPRWLDGYRSFRGMTYDSGAALLVDVR